MSDAEYENCIQQSGGNNFSPTGQGNSAKVYENEGVDDIYPNPFELHEKYQEFIKANGSRNTSQDLDPDEIEDSNVESTFESESASNSKVDELLHFNKSFRQRNEELQGKTEMLTRQLEFAEDQNEQHKKEINTLEKELKCCHDMLRDRDNLENELENVQKELRHVCESKTKLEGQVKRLKTDKDELISMNNVQLEKVENLSDDLQCELVRNKGLYDENASLKDRCESLKLDIEMKDKEVEEKMQLYQEIRDEVECLKGTNQNLLQEKDTLVLKLREFQLEVSYYQTGLRTSDEMHLTSLSNSSRQLFSLHSEIAEAEQGIHRNPFHCSSPLSCGSAANDPASSAGSALAFCDASTHSHLLIFQNSSSQTEEINADAQQPAFLALKEQCFELQDNLQAKEKAILELSEALTKHKNKEQYFARQLGMNFNKMRELVLQNQKQVADIRQLSEINSKLCSSKLHTWLDENQVMVSRLSGGDGVGEEGVGDHSIYDVDASASKLVDALALENFSAYEANTQVGSVALCFNNLHITHKMGNIESFVNQVKHVLKHDMSSINARLLVLNKCSCVVEEAITKKIELIRSLLRDALQWQHFGASDDDRQLQCSSIKLSQDIKEYLQSAHALMRQLGKYSKPVGALEMEKRYGAIIEIFIEHINALKTRSYWLEKKLTKSKQSSDRFWLEAQAKMYGFNGASVVEDSHIVEITPNLLKSVTVPQSKWVQTLSRNRHVGGLFEALMGLSYKVHTSFPSLSRTSYLLFTLLLCCFFSLSWVDYKVDPVF